MSFWDKKSIQEQKNTVYNEEATEPMILDEEVLSEIQGEEYNVFEEEDEDTTSIMHDANLRLEQGRLYQMVLQGDIFADTNADPKAIKNVQREIRKFVRERMETMLGIRQEQIAATPIVSSPFNDLEVTALKMVASRVSGGATEKTVEGPSLPPANPKKNGITAISGNLKPETTPLKKEVKPIQKIQPNKKPASSKPSAAKTIIDQVMDGNLKKPINEMTAEELAAHDKEALERRSRNYAALPNNLVPHPTPQQLEMLYTTQVAQNPAPGSAVARMTDLINGRTQ